MTDAKPLRRALVTGGSGDLGGAICRALADTGYHVIVHANRGLERAETKPPPENPPPPQPRQTQQIGRASCRERV